VFWLAAAAVLLAGIAAAGARYLESEAARAEIERELSKRAHGRVGYRSLDVALLPTPRAELRAVEISVPNAIDGRAEAVVVRFALLPLLVGRFRPEQVHFDRPELAVSLPDGGAGEAFARYRETIGPIVTGLVRDAKGMRLSASGGSVRLRSGRQVWPVLSELEVAMEVSGAGVEAELACVSGLWRRAEASGRIAAESLAASARLKVSGLDGNDLVERLLPGRGHGLRPGPVDASLEAETDGRAILRAKVRADARELAIGQEGQAIVPLATRMVAEGSRDAKALVVTVSELVAGSLATRVQASLRSLPDGSSPAFELRAATLDLAPLRSVVLSASGDQPGPRALVEPIASGTLQDVVLRASAKDFAALRAPGSIGAEARLEGGAFALPHAEVTAVRGRLALSGGTLEVGDLSGRLGRSAFESGTVVVRVAAPAHVERVEASVNADLAETLAIVRRSATPDHREALAQIETLDGRAAGRFRYLARRDRPVFELDLASVQASMRHRRAPFGLAIARGTLAYGDGVLRARGLSGSFGASRFAGASFDVALGGETTIRDASAQAVLALDELSPWLRSLGPAFAWPNDLQSLEGTANVRLRRLRGPPGSVAALDFDANVEPRPIRARIASLPAPLIASGGSFSVTPHALQFDQLAIEAGDARATLNGSAQDYRLARRRVQLAIPQATIGRQAIDWAQAHLKIAPEWMLRPPLAVTQARLDLGGDASGSARFLGRLVAGDAVSVELHVETVADAVQLRALAVKDADSDFQASVVSRPGMMDATFAGRLDARTLARALANPPAIGGTFSGKLRLGMDLQDRARSRAEGTLSGTGLDVLRHRGIPVVLDRFDLVAEGDLLRVRESRVSVDGQMLAASGTLKRGPKAFELDGEVKAGGVDAKRIEDVIRRIVSGRERRAAPRAGPQVTGRVAFTADSIAWGERVLRPVAGALSFSPGRTVAEIREAYYCGISMPFTVAFVEGADAVLSGRARARGQSLREAAACVGGQRFVSSGTFDLDAEFAANGPPETLSRRLLGRVHWVAREGRIERGLAVPRVLELDEVAQRLPGRASEMMAQGIEFDRLATTIAFTGARLSIEHATFEGPTIGLAGSGEIDLAARTIAMHGVVAPFSGVSAAVRRFPVLGRALGTRIVVVPVSIAGGLDDPKVAVAPAGAVGATVANLIGTVLKAPFEVLDLRDAKSAPQTPADASPAN